LPPDPSHDQIRRVQGTPRHFRSEKMVLGFGAAVGRGCSQSPIPWRKYPRAPDRGRARVRAAGGCPAGAAEKKKPTRRGVTVWVATEVNGCIGGCRKILVPDSWRHGRPRQRTTNTSTRPHPSPGDRQQQFDRGGVGIGSARQLSSVTGAERTGRRFRGMADSAGTVCCGCATGQFPSSGVLCEQLDDYKDAALLRRCAGWATLARPKWGGVGISADAAILLRSPADTFLDAGGPRILIIILKLKTRCIEKIDYDTAMAAQATRAENQRFLSVGGIIGFIALRGAMRCRPFD